MLTTPALLPHWNDRQLAEYRRRAQVPVEVGASGHRGFKSVGAWILADALLYRRRLTVQEVGALLPVGAARNKRAAAAWV